MAPENQRVRANLVLLHHLPDPAALLANDVAMQLVRHFDVLRYGHQRLKEEARLLLRKWMKEGQHHVWN